MNHLQPGIVQPPAASVADFAQAQAAAGRASISGRFAARTTQLVLPDNLVAPDTVDLAAAALTPKLSGLFVVSGTLTFIASAPDTGLQLALVRITGTGITVTTTGAPTNVVGGLLYETTGHPVVVAGGALVQTVIGGGVQQMAAAVLQATMPFFAMVALPLGAVSAIELGITSSSGVNYSSLALAMAIYEMP